MTTARTSYGSPHTLEDFLTLPEQEPALEFNPDGSITQKMSPTSDHAELQAHLAWLLRDHVRAHMGGRGHVYTELRVNAGGASRLPDVAFSRERPPLSERGHALRAPELAIEIRSPSESLEAQRDKCDWWRAVGALVVLLVDPERRAVDCLAAVGNRGWAWRTYSGRDIPPPLAIMFEDLDLAADAIFAVLDTP
jgi:Uma2 family endonuclease